MAWDIEYLPEAIDDLISLDNSVRTRALKAIEKLAQNPLPDYEGGYGKPLGNKRISDLAGFLKCKLRKDGIRIVYQVIREGETMRVIIIGARADNEVYRLAAQRKRKHSL